MLALARPRELWAIERVDELDRPDALVDGKVIVQRHGLRRFMPRQTASESQDRNTLVGELLRRWKGRVFANNDCRIRGFGRSVSRAKRDREGGFERGEEPRPCRES